MENRRTGFNRDEKPAGIKSSFEQVKREERRQRDALEDDDVFESLKRLHHEPAPAQHHAHLPEIVRG